MGTTAAHARRKQTSTTWPENFGQRRISGPERDQDAEAGHRSYRQEGSVMPLRPVSELGLVDVTDLGSREGNDTATRRSQRSKRTPSAHSGRQGTERDHQRGRPGAQSEHEPPSTPVRQQTPRNTSKRPSSSTLETSPSPSERRAARAARKSTSAGASPRKDATRQKSVSSKPTSANASTPRTSKRSGGESKPARQVSSGVSAKSGSPSVRKPPRSSGSGSRRAAPAENSTSMTGGTRRASATRWRSRPRVQARKQERGTRHTQCFAGQCVI